jgi:hypothetical protein
MWADCRSSTHGSVSCNSGPTLANPSAVVGILVSRASSLSSKPLRISRLRHALRICPYCSSERLQLLSLLTGLTVHYEVSLRHDHP